MLQIRRNKNKKRNSIFNHIFVSFLFDCFLRWMTDMGHTIFPFHILIPNLQTVKLPRIISQLSKNIISKTNLYVIRIFFILCLVCAPQISKPIIKNKVQMVFSHDCMGKSFCLNKCEVTPKQLAVKPCFVITVSLHLCPWNNTINHMYNIKLTVIQT